MQQQGQSVLCEKKDSRLLMTVISGGFRVRLPCAAGCVHARSAVSDSLRSHGLIPWTAAHQAPPSMGFSRQACWSGLPCPPPGDPPDLEIKLGALVSPALQAASLPPEPSGKPIYVTSQDLIPPVHLRVRKWEFYQLFITNQIGLNRRTPGT